MQKPNTIISKQAFFINNLLSKPNKLLEFYLHKVNMKLDLIVWRTEKVSVEIYRRLGKEYIVLIGLSIISLISTIKKKNKPRYNLSQRIFLLGSTIQKLTIFKFFLIILKLISLNHSREVWVTNIFGSSPQQRRLVNSTKIER